MGKKGKKCFKCGKEKPLTEFYKHGMMKDGHLNKCIDCAKSDVKKDYERLINDPNWVDKERKRGRKKYHKYKHRYKSSTNAKTNIKYMEIYPEKYYAKIASQRIELGFDGAEKHHWSYNQEHYKDVIQLSKKDHMKAHRFLVYDQERMMYRTLNGDLLDTRERHIKYIADRISKEED